MARLLLLAAAMIALAAAAPAQDFGRIARVDVLPGWRTDAGTHMAALRIRLDPGWKTYWRVPGEAGIPPRIDWSGSTNVAGLRLHWPTPRVFRQNGLRSIGYADMLVLPVEVTPKRPGQPVTLRGALDIGVCEEVCVPYSASVSAPLPMDARRPDGAIRAALADRPRTAAEAGLRDLECSVEPIDDGLRLTARIALPQIAQSEHVAVELDRDDLWISDAETRRDGDTLTASADLVPDTGEPFLLDRSKLRLTVLGGAEAVDIRGCAAG